MYFLRPRKSVVKNCVCLTNTLFGDFFLSRDGGSTVFFLRLQHLIDFVWKCGHRLKTRSHARAQTFASLISGPKAMPSSSHRQLGPPRPSQNKSPKWDARLAVRGPPTSATANSVFPLLPPTQNLTTSEPIPTVRSDSSKHRTPPRHRCAAPTSPPISTRRSLL
jgi:hypothetical protein